jgi:putative GTP pyrophosphokinase
MGEFDEKLELFRSLAQSMESLISILIASSSIEPHSISCRVKERKSLTRKVEKKDKYESLYQITDIVGIRIISNYSDEVDKIAEIIERQFDVDTENSIDKRASLDPDRFGYLSLHYVVSLRAERSKLVEYNRFEGLKFEIQIRSILQHTWAEIEHDIGYKSKIEIPKPIRRKFSRLAGLLELADDQFVQIREDLGHYEKVVQDTIVAKPESINIDAVSIFEYANTSGIIKNLDDKVVRNANLNLKPLDKDDAARHVKYLKYFGIETIFQLGSALNENEQLILKRAKDINGDNGIVSQGISIFYLHQVLASKKLDKQGIVLFLNKMGMCLEPDREQFAEYLVKLNEGNV